jgi:ParB family chromosome partitioning protein
MDRRVLGKGLDALIPKRPLEELKKEFVYLPLEKVKEGKHQPRKELNPHELRELTQSIKEKGLIQPIVVRKLEDQTYEIVAGARRFQAAKSLGLKEIPTLIKDLNDKDSFILAITENLQRKDLNPLEEAMAFKKLMDEFEFTLEEVGKFLGKDKSSVANTLRLLKLPADIQDALRRNIITRTQARTILSVVDQEQQRKLFHKMLQEGLSVRELERRVRKISPKKRKRGDPFVLDMEERLQKLLGTKVRIVNKKNNSGKIIIEYYSAQDFNRITKKIS